MQVKQIPASHSVIFCVHTPSLPSENTQVRPSCAQTFTGSVAVPVGAAPDDLLDVHAPTPSRQTNTTTPHRFSTAPR